MIYYNAPNYEKFIDANLHKARVLQREWELTKTEKELKAFYKPFDPEHKEKLEKLK